MSIEDQARAHLDGHPGNRATPPQGSPVAALHDIAIRLNANPLITAIDAHPGMGQNLTAQDVDTVLRVIASIEAARIEVPTRYEQATANRAAAQDGQ
jgi:hypothetical protein